MTEHFLGIDIGSISTKCVIIDEKDNIIYKNYIWTNGNPIKAVEEIIKPIKGYNIKGIGTTGSGRNLIGLMFFISLFRDISNT